jgi:hypothetical protein
MLFQPVLSSASCSYSSSDWESFQAGIADKLVPPLRLRAFALVSGVFNQIEQLGFREFVH